MSERAPYSRVYWSIVDDPKFVTIFDDDRHLATWLRLLMGADQAWPASATLPATARRSSVQALSDAGIVDLVAGGRYRVRGLDKEREKRKTLATTRGPSGDRPVTRREPNGFASQDLAETRRDEKSRADATTSDDDDGRADLEAFLLVKRHPPTERQRKLLDGLLDRHDLTGPKWAADIILRNPDDPIGAVIKADQEWRAQRIAEAQSAEKPKPVPRRSHGLPQSAKDILAEMKRLDAEGAA